MSYLGFVKSSFSSNERYNVATVDVSETEISGNGGAHAPVLILPVRVDYHIHPDNPRTGMRFLQLRGQIDVDHRPFTVAPAVSTNVTLRPDFKALPNQLHHLYFPLDAVRISFLERARNGGSLKFKVQLSLTVEKLHALHDPPVPHEAVWGTIYRQELHVQLELAIPGEAWASRVLPQIGYGSVYFIELPAIPLSAVEPYKEAFQALQRAQQHHRDGLYNEAAGMCRVALERFFDYPEVTGPDNLTRKVPTLKKSWETKLGKATYDWLNGSLSAIKMASNPAHHRAGPHYDQLEAQILIAITVAVVAYAAKHDLPANA